MLEPSKSWEGEKVNDKIGPYSKDGEDPTCFFAPGYGDVVCRPTLGASPQRPRSSFPTIDSPLCPLCRLVIVMPLVDLISLKLQIQGFAQGGRILEQLPKRPYIHILGVWLIMINLFSLKQKQKEAADANRGNSAKKQSPGELRVQKDISELNLSKSTSIAFPYGKDNLLSFEITIQPDEGYYQGGTFVFSFQISTLYPHEAPKVKCKTKVYHPNIDWEGNVCLNILREDWKPVLSISSIIYGLQYLFLDPNPDDPLNREAADILVNNPKQFEINVRRSMSGGTVGGQQFTRCI